MIVSQFRSSSRPLSETIKCSILYYCSLPLGLHILHSSLIRILTIFYPWHDQLECDHRIFDCLNTISTTSGPRLVFTMLERINFLSRSTPRSQSSPLSSNDYLVSAVGSPSLKAVFVLDRFLLFSTPAHQLTLS